MSDADNSDPLAGLTIQEVLAIADSDSIGLTPIPFQFSDPADKSHYDIFAPPGILTARGSVISIDRQGSLYVGHGSRAATVQLSPLQWQLVSVALTKLGRNDHRGAIWIETEVASVQLKQSRFGIELRARDRSSYLAVGLTKSEADDLKKAAGQRAPHRTSSKGEV